VFSALETWSSTDHVYHAFHHKFTTIYRQVAPQNPQKPLQKSTSTTPIKKSISGTQGFGRVTQSRGCRIGKVR
jgi:hypothetical protein